MTAYKIVRKLKNGDLAPLFINKRQRIKMGTWLEAESHPTPGYAVRPGWHCTVKPEAPHLSNKGRVWCQVEVKNYKKFKRPESQGGVWVLAQKIKFIKEL